MNFSIYILIFLKLWDKWIFRYRFWKQTFQFKTSFFFDLTNPNCLSNLYKFYFVLYLLDNFAHIKLSIPLQILCFKHKTIPLFLTAYFSQHILLYHFQSPYFKWKKYRKLRFWTTRLPFSLKKNWKEQKGTRTFFYTQRFLFLFATRQYGRTLD